MAPESIDPPTPRPARAGAAASRSGAAAPRPVPAFIRPRPPRVALWAAYTLVLASALAGLFLVDYLAGLHTVLIIALAVTAALTFRTGQPRLAICAAVAAVIGLAWAIGHWYPLYVALSLLAIGVAVIGSAVELRRSRPRTRLRRAIRAVVVIVIAAPTAVLTAVLGITAITPVPLITALQATLFPADNSFRPAATTTRTAEGAGHVEINDIRYGRTYPNSYLDVHLARPGVKAPTVIYVHGGGYTWGDKGSGDPTSGTTSGALAIYKPFLDAGYNVVAVDYALAPTYNYPVPVLQLSEAVKFLEKHGSEYGISTDRVALVGGSAGGQLVGQFAALQTNPDYSRQVGIPASIPASSIRMVVFNSALLDLTRFADTGFAPIDWIFLQCGRAYFGGGFLTSDDVREANVIDAIDAHFPPTYIADGNFSTFHAQANDLDARMTELKIPHTFTFFPRSVAQLFHGYETGSSPQAAENLKKELAYMAKYLPAAAR